jgi:sugar phosphate isomerase/epimerase
MLFLPSSSFPHYGLERFFSFAKQVGFDGVEIMVTADFDTQNPDYLLELQKRFEMPIRVFSLPAENADKFIDALEKVIPHFPRTTLNLASPEIFSFRYKTWIEQRVPRLVQEFGLKFNWKSMPIKTIMGVVPTRSEGSIHQLKEKGSVSLDMVALWQSHEDVMRAINFLGSNLQHVYLGNVNKGLMYTPLSIGELPVESMLTKLARESFRGEFTLKISPQNLREGHDEKLLEILRESKTFVDRYFTAVVEAMDPLSKKATPPMATVAPVVSQLVA